MHVAVHFAKCELEVHETYHRVLEVARAIGPVVEEPKPEKFWRRALL